MGISGPYGVQGSAAVSRLREKVRAGQAGGFLVPEARTGDGPAGTGQVGLSSLLGLQEARQDAERDRDAREHGEALVDALGALQGALLGGGDPGALTRLAALVRCTPAPADPHLASLQRQLLLRVAVELARRSPAASV